MLNRVHTIKSRDFDYDVFLSNNFESLLQHFSSLDGSVFVVDNNVAELYPDLIQSLALMKPMLTIEASETVKTLNGASQVIEWLLASGCNRSATIVGIGGGIIQDVVTFTAAIYYRGVQFELVPTTLLSMADSSIGAKCGINFGEYKNQIGIVNAPRAVHISTKFLDSLSERDILSGYGEILKLAITGGETQFSRLLDTVESKGLRDGAIDLIEQSLLVKKLIIEEDEHERDLRRILNYGHTFGHAIESLTNHAIPHGLAVAWGIDLVNYLSVKRFGLNQSIKDRVHAFISSDLPFTLGKLPTTDELVEHVRRDKKMVGQVLHLVVPFDFGDLRIVPTQIDDEFCSVVSDYLKFANVYSSSN